MPVHKSVEISSLKVRTIVGKQTRKGRNSTSNLAFLAFAKNSRMKAFTLNGKGPLESYAANEQDIGRLLTQ